MRDADRIKRICMELETIWNENPDWRFYQLIANTLPKTDKDLFYIEDDEAEANFLKFLGLSNENDKFGDIPDLIYQRIGIILTAPESYDEVKDVFKQYDPDENYYYTGTYDYVPGVGLIPPCDKEMYEKLDKQILKVDKWVRRSIISN